MNMNTGYSLEADLAKQLPTVSPYAQGLDVSQRPMDELFPAISLDFEPFGTRIIVQLRRVIAKTSSGIILHEETKATEAWNMQVGKILAIGPLAFKNRRTGDEWPEGQWAQVGDFVRFARHVGDRLSVKLNEQEDEQIALLILNDADLIGRYMGDPRAVRAYLL